MFAVGLVLFVISMAVLFIRKDEPAHAMELPFVLAFIIGFLLILASFTVLAWRFLP